MQCKIEEAAERIFLHAKNVALSNTKILVKTVNSDAVVIAVVSVCHCIPNSKELWVEFGKEKDLKYIVVHIIVSNLGVMSATAPPFFFLL